jgi:hypothetical protein
MLLVDICGYSFVLDLNISRLLFSCSSRNSCMIRLPCSRCSRIDDCCNMKTYLYEKKRITIINKIHSVYVHSNCALFLQYNQIFHMDMSRHGLQEGICICDCLIHTYAYSRAIENGFIAVDKRMSMCLTEINN